MLCTIALFGVQDGRLRENDRLVRLNGVSLVGRSNSTTMRTLRQALRCRGPVPGHVDVVVARRAAASQPAAVTQRCGSSSQVLSAADTPPPARHTDRTSDATKTVLRNVSYQLANGGDSGGGGTATPPPPPLASETRPLMAAMKAPTINGGRVDTVLIETDASRPTSVSSQSLSSHFGQSTSLALSGVAIRQGPWGRGKVQAVQ